MSAAYAQRTKAAVSGAAFGKRISIIPESDSSAPCAELIVFTFRIQINSKYEYAQGELQTLRRGLRRGKTPQKHQEGGGKPAKNGGRLKPAAGKKTAAANCRAK